MDEMRYALLTEVTGRSQAEIIEALLQSEEIGAVLVEENIGGSMQQTTFAPVKIFVPRESLKRARSLLDKFNENEDDTKESPDMANKRKISERELKMQAHRTERTIQYIGLGVIALVVIAVIVYLVANRAPKPSAKFDTGNQTAACQPFADIPISAQYSAPPLKIDTGKQYFAAVKLAKGGQFVIQLYPDKAPKTVNSFVFLSCKGYFNGVTFHRVLEGFMAQGGDPTGTGQGGPGYQFENEDSDLTFDKPGVVAMANAGRDTNGSQFFITFGPTTQLNGGYTIFGQVTSGMDVVNNITRRDPEQNPSFTGDAIQSVTITEK